MASNVSKVKEDGPIREARADGAGKGVGDKVGIGGITEDEGAAEEGISEDWRASDLCPLAFLGPLKVIVGSSRFEQFFFTYATLMAGLRLSKVIESKVTPLALHKAVIKAGNPSLEESCWAIMVIW